LHTCTIPTIPVHTRNKYWNLPLGEKKASNLFWSNDVLSLRTYHCLRRRPAPQTQKGTRPSKGGPYPVHLRTGQVTKIKGAVPKKEARHTHRRQSLLLLKPKTLAQFGRLKTKSLPTKKKKKKRVIGTPAVSGYPKPTTDPPKPDIHSRRKEGVITQSLKQGFFLGRGGGWRIHLEVIGKTKIQFRISTSAWQSMPGGAKVRKKGERKNPGNTH